MVHTLNRLNFTYKKTTAVPCKADPEKQKEFIEKYEQLKTQKAEVVCDQTIVFSNSVAAKDYPEKLRRIRYYDAKNQKYLTFLTNSFTLPALTIALIYKSR